MDYYSKNSRDRVNRQIRVKTVGRTEYQSGTLYDQLTHLKIVTKIFLLILIETRRYIEIPCFKLDLLWT